MAKRCKYIYKGKTYSKEEFMALLAGGEYENILAEYESVPSTGMTEEDFASIESSGVLGTGTISVKSKQSRSKYIDSLSLERLPLHENVTVTTNVNPATLNGQTVSSTLSDKLIAGILRGKDSAFKFLGGVGYGPATGRWWAFSRLSDAEKLINSTEVSKDGYKYLVPALMSDTSHLSNKNMTIMVMNLFKEAAANKELNTEQFKALVDKTFDKKSLSRHKPYITKVMEKYTDIDDLISGIQEAVISGNLTFEDRKSMISSFVGDSTVNKPKFKTIGTLTELAEDLSEPISKDVPLHNAVVIYRTKGDLKAVETDKDDEFYHESYGVHVESSSQIEVLYLDGSYPITDLIPEFTTKGDKKNPSKTYRTDEEVMSKIAKGWTVERALTNLGRTHGLSAYSAPINIKSKSSKGMGALKDVESTAKALEGVDEKEKLAVKEINDRFVKNKEDGKQESENTNIILKRLSSEEEQGRRRGGKANVDATIITARVQESGDKNGWSERKIKQNQENELRTYAEQQGLWVGDVSELTNDPDAKGAESLVMYSNDGKSVEKYTSNKIHHRDWSEFFDRIAIHNTLFPETAYEVVGFGEIKGETVVKLKQPLVHAEREATASEIIQDMENRGFKSLGLGRFHNKETGVFVGDLFYGNVVVSKRGNLLYIDPITKLDSDEASVKTTRNKFPLEISNTEAPAEALGSGVKTRAISQAYHKAKADGSNPELVQAVESLLSENTQSVEQKTQGVTDLTPLFNKSQELFEKISDAAGGSKKRSSAEERRKFMDDNPDIKYIDDNMAYIYKQIEDNNLGKKEGNCPL